nr:hypothetical protein GCM10025732_58680 [Glycomyces mayteni]
MLSSLDAEFALGEAATGLDVPNRTVTTENGRTVSADAIVIATGIRARTLPGAAGLGGVHVLRTIEDALKLKGELAQVQRLVVVGDGVLGAEIAATASSLGPDVALVGPQAAPMEMQLGPGVAKHLAEMHTERGVRLRPGVGVAGLEERDGRVTGCASPPGRCWPRTRSRSRSGRSRPPSGSPAAA